MLLCWLCSTERSQLILLSYIQLRYVHTLHIHSIRGLEKYLGQQNILLLINIQQLVNDDIL